MRIVNLVENTQGEALCPAEHGLSFYIETKNHKVLMDTGQSDLLIRNAAALGVDLSQVDTVVISHGHYDHGGGLLPFLKVNQRAEIFIQLAAQDDFYSMARSEEDPQFIGLDEELFSSERITWMKGNRRLNEEMEVFTGIPSKRPIPSANQALKVKTPEGSFIQDDFSHEQCLVVREGEMLVLFSGCAHHGILNILDEFEKLYGRSPDAVFSGFHLRKTKGYTELDIREFLDLAYALKKYPTRFYTGHCTGEEPFAILKKHLGDQLVYVHCGDEVNLSEKDFAKPVQEKVTSEQRTEETKNTKGKERMSGKRKGKGMKLHRFFAWATVVCFVMTMVTGYKKK